MPPSHKGLQALFTYPLMSAIFDRRTRRVARGTSIVSGPLGYTSPNKPAPLTPLEEAVLVVSTGLTGKTTMHDVPAKNDDGTDRFSAPLINVLARSASSIDNAHAVSFFLINDEGTWLIRQFRNQDALALLSKLPPRWEDWSEADWIAAAASVKHRLYKERLDFPRHWPYYFIWNRQISNRPGTTILLPIVDLTRQFINVIISLLSEEDGQRPLFVDDWQRFRPRTLLDWGAWFASLVGIVPNISYQIIGGARRARGNWLNSEYPAPIGFAGTLRTDYETFFQLQNLMLIAQGMGLGGWLHAAVGSPYVFERDPAKGKFGIEFRMQKPKKWRRWPPLPTPLDNPIGIDGLLESLTPPVRAVDECGGGQGDRGEVRAGRHLRRQHHLRSRLQEGRIRGRVPEDGEQASDTAGRRVREGDLQLHLRYVRALPCARECLPPPGHLAAVLAPRVGVLRQVLQRRPLPPPSRAS
jgi:hypothetical protein